MSAVMRLLRAGMTPGDELREAAYAAWQAVAVPRDPGWPFGRDDFERHYAGALGKARKLDQYEDAWLHWVLHGCGGMAWAIDVNARAAAASAAERRSQRTRPARVPGRRMS